MRPLSGGDSLPAAKPRSRKSSLADQSTAHTGPSSHVPTTFFLRSELEMEQPLSSSQSTEPASKQGESTYGVQSLEETLEAAFGQDSRVADKAHAFSTTTNDENESSRSHSHDSSKASSKHSGGSASSPIRKHKRKASGTMISAPPTPLDIDVRSPLPASAIPSTPKSASLHSLKLSDEDSGLDESASQVITSSGEEDEETQQGESSSFPELVMPSIQMPKRRPFTTKGRAMGKLKVLFAGEAGIGKSSLIRSIVQLCEDIVHVDPLSPTQSFSQSPPPPKSKSKSRKRKIESTATTKMTEIHASTKTFPHWWNDLEESRVRRRKSSSESVLERNLCFVDTPGYGEPSSSSDEQNLVVNYIESLLYQNTSIPSMEDNDLLGVIGGSGGVQVDVVFYLLRPDHDISKDVQYMQRLSALTNVIPIIAKSDTLAAAEVVAIKTSILARLQTTTINPFFFGKPIEDALLSVQGLPILAASVKSSPASNTPEPKQYPFSVPTYPYAISSISGPDSDTMDASLLMSPDYIQPLLPSELTTLINQVFDPDSIAWLRHSSAKKFLAWRRRTKLPGDSLILHGLQQPSLKRASVSSSSVGLTGPAMQTSGTSSIFSAASPSGVLVPRATSPFYLSNYNSNLQSPFPASSPSLSHTQLECESPTDISLARYNHFAQGEQRLAEVRLAKWATDLQRSLRNERERFGEMERSERAKWLLERVGEEVREGTIITSPTGSPRAEWAVARRGSEKNRGSNKYGKAGNLSARDPLGLCDFGDEIKRRGFVLVKVLGGMSVLGAVIVAVVRACGVETGLPETGVWSWLTGRGE